MSKRVVLAAALLTIRVAGPAVAQDHAAWRDSVARLGGAVRALTDSLKTGDSTVVEISRRSGMILRASRDLDSVANPALDRFLASKRHWFGKATPSTGGFRILLKYYGGYYSRSGPDRLPQSLEVSEEPDSDERTRGSRGVSRREIGNADSASSALLFEFGRMMLARSDIRLQKWLLYPLPLHLGERDRRLAAMYPVIIGPGKSQRACLGGSLPDCAYVLSLREAEGADPGGAYEELVRADLLLVALEAGGENAWERLQGATGKNLADQLSAAAGLPLDSLLATWRRGLLAFRPTDRPLTLGQAFVGGLWAALLLAGAIGVSRWA